MGVKDMRRISPRVEKMSRLSEAKKEIQAHAGRGATVLYAGPWNGEFGWELCSWNPFIRHEARHFKHVIVETVPGSEYLYEFADEIVLNPRAGDFDMYSGRSKNPPRTSEKEWLVLTPKHHWKRGGGQAEFRAIKRATRDDKQIPSKEWRVFGTENPHFVADIMCAFRGPKTFKGRAFPEKQWREDRCNELVEMFKKEGFSVACYGGVDNHQAPGAMDYRGRPLEEVTGALSKAKLAIGPSSGTIHLASLCKTPHVTWYGRPIVSLDRYMFYWNPHETPCTFIDIPDPNTKKVFEAGMRRMSAATEKLHYTK